MPPIRAADPIFDVRGSVDHVQAVAELYKNHWLARDLNALTAALHTREGVRRQLNQHASNFDIYLRRLKRLRNAAIHGGPVTEKTCLSTAPFASALAHRGLNESIRALLAGRDIAEHIAEYRSDQHSRWERANSTGEIDALFQQPEM